MIVEGERIKELVARAERDVILCAPFIKVKVLSVLLGLVPQGASVRVITRWRPAEVAAGLSDLEVYDVVNERPKTSLGLLYPLHAKLYVTDDNCLVGSANLTATALGWCENPNLEILLPAHRSDSNIAALIEQLAFAVPATFQIRAEIAAQAAALSVPDLDESQEVPSELAGRLRAPWLPRCAAPNKLFAVYQNRETTAVVEGTRSDAIADLNALMPPPNLSREAFTNCINASLYQMPCFQRIIERIPGRLGDAEGTAMIAELRPDLQQSDVERQWRIVRDWISTFFQDRFEVAPDSYVVRLRSH